MSDGPPAIPTGPEAIGSSESLGLRESEDQGRMFPCEGCGADFKFHIGAQALKCPFCGHEKRIELGDSSPTAEHDLHRMLDRLVEQRQGQGQALEGAEIRCTSCGAQVVFSGTLTSTHCSHCGSPIQRKDVHEAKDRVPVDGMLPFQVKRREAREEMKKWVKSRWFAPNEFLARGVEGKFAGIYMPFWTYDTFTSNWYTGERGEHYWVTVGSGKNRRRVRRTRWWPASGNFQRFFDDVLVCGAKEIPRKQVRELEPWPLSAAVPFSPEAMAGFLAQTYSIPLDVGFTDFAKPRIDAAIETEVRWRIGGDVQRIHSIHTRYEALTFKHLLLPVWLLAYRYHEKSYRVVVNATTGEVQGERPWSWVKITLAALAAAVLIATVVFFVQSQ